MNNNEHWGRLFANTGADDLFRRAMTMAIRAVGADDDDTIHDIKATLFVACLECLGRWDLRVEDNRIKAAQLVLARVRDWFSHQSDPPDVQHLSLEMWNNLGDADIIDTREVLHSA